MAGVPARQIGWMSRFGERLDIAFGDSGRAVCSHTGDAYHVTGAECSLITEP